MSKVQSLGAVAMQVAQAALRRAPMQSKSAGNIAPYARAFASDLCSARSLTRPTPGADVEGSVGGAPFAAVPTSRERHGSGAFLQARQPGAARNRLVPGASAVRGRLVPPDVLETLSRKGPLGASGATASLATQKRGFRLENFCTEAQLRATDALSQQKADESALEQALALSKQEFDRLANQPSISGQSAEASSDSRFAPNRTGAEPSVRAAKASASSPCTQAFEILGCELPRPLSSTQLGSLELAPSEVSLEQMGEQVAAAQPLNRNFGKYLRQLGIRAVPNSGRGNNCAIYSLVQGVRPDLAKAELDDVVAAIRTRYDERKPDSKGSMLHLDTGAGGDAPLLLELVNDALKVNVAVVVVQAGAEEKYPVTHLGSFMAHGADTGFTHTLVVHDQHTHYELLAAAVPSRNASHR